MTRSASALTVASISSFCSSVKRSHFASSVAVNPLTLVSGERNSWATVLTRSARLRSSRSRDSVPRRLTTTRWTTRRRIADVARGGQQLALRLAGHQQQPALGLAVTPGSRSSGAEHSHQSLPRSSSSGDELGQPAGPAPRAPRRAAQQRSRHCKPTVPSASRTIRPSGSSSATGSTAVGQHRAEVASVGEPASAARSRSGRQSGATRRSRHRASSACPAVRCPRR